MAQPPIQSWDGTQFIFPETKVSGTFNGKVPSDFASASHQHIRAAITDFAHKSTHAIGGVDAIAPEDIGALATSGGTMSGKLYFLPGQEGGMQFPNDALGESYGVASITLQNPTGQVNEMTFYIGTEGGDHCNFNFKAYHDNSLRMNDHVVWHAGNFDPTTKSNTDHDHTYGVNSPWFGYKGNTNNVKIHGNTRQIAFRTDGKSEYATGVGDYPYMFMYGGDGLSNRIMMINDAGDLWTKYNGWLSQNLEGKVTRKSESRPGVDRIYRRDADSGQNVQVDWTGSYWRLRGYSGDTLHAECLVDQANNADKVDGYDAVDFVTPFAVTTGGDVAFAATFTPSFAKVTGRTVRIQPNVNSGASPTLDANGTGAVAILKADGTAATLKSGGIYTLTYSATQSAFILQGEGGGVDPSTGATATAFDIAKGKTAAVGGSKITGTHEYGMFISLMSPGVSNAYGSFELLSDTPTEKVYKITRSQLAIDSGYNFTSVLFPRCTLNTGERFCLIPTLYTRGTNPAFASVNVAYTAPGVDFDYTGSAYQTSISVSTVKDSAANTLTLTLKFTKNDLGKSFSSINAPMVYFSS